MRDLANLVTVETVTKMKDKDRIVCVSFKENAFEAITDVNTQVGDILIFIQEGSILPETETWEFLRKRCFNEKLKGHLIKPMTMGKKEDGSSVRSWGLALKPEATPYAEKLNNLKAGADITDILEIRKYEPDETNKSPTSGSSTKIPKFIKFCYKHKALRWISKAYTKLKPKQTAYFPSEYITKSDETALQNYKLALTKFKDEDVVITAKMEGQSGTALCTLKNKKLDRFVLCSRNLALKKDNSLFWQFALENNIEEKIREYYKKYKIALVLQFEQCGPSIQNNIYDFKSTKWYLFTAKDALTGETFSYDRMQEIAEYMGINTVPFIKAGKLSDVFPTVEDAVAFAENQMWVTDKNGVVISFEKTSKNKLWKDCFLHEGVVIRTKTYNKEQGIGMSIKVKNLAYAEKGIGEIHKEFVKYKNNLK